MRKVGPLCPAEFMARPRAVESSSVPVACRQDRCGKSRGKSSLCWPHHLPVRERRWQDIRPVLVVEVLYDDDPDKDLVRNVELYLQVPSIREYWIIDGRNDPDRPVMFVYRRRGRRWQNVIRVAAGDVYETRLLPDFRLLLEPRA